MFKKISILGCGWLGLPLANHLVDSGFKVNGSTTSQEKLSELNLLGVHPFHIECIPEIQGNNLQDFFATSALFLNIPFRRNLSDPKYYQAQIDSVVSYVSDSPIKHVVFASSTSVYPLNVEKAIEEQEFVPDTQRSAVLFDIEQSLITNKNFKSTILRFSGLYGGARKIGQFLSGKKELDSPMSPVNLVHLEDCISIVSSILQRDTEDQIFNVCCDKHPTRQELYTKAALNMNLEVPQFLDDMTTGKIVCNDKIKKYLNYQFKYPDPMESI